MFSRSCYLISFRGLGGPINVWGVSTEVTRRISAQSHVSVCMNAPLNRVCRRFETSLLFLKYLFYCFDFIPSPNTLFYVLLTVHFSNIWFLVSNLMHLFIIFFHTPLHVSRILCISSGGSTVYPQHLVLYLSFFLCDRSVHRQLEASSNCLCTERSNKKSET